MSNTENADVSSTLENDMSDILSIISNISDENIDSKETVFLNSLKPYLNKKRQKKNRTMQKNYLYYWHFEVFK
jgi:hypothetical protein